MANSFALDVKAFADSFSEGAERAVRSTVVNLSASFIDTSPVDTGRFKSNWFVTGQSPSTKIATSTDKSGQKTKAAAEGKALSIQDWSTFHITNNLPYSEVIEFGRYGNGPDTIGGYSTQAPQGVVRVNIARFNSLLNEEAAKRLPK